MKLCVKVVTGAMVEHIDERGAVAGGKRIERSTVIWTAGVSPSPLVKMLGRESGWPDFPPGSFGAFIHLMFPLQL